MNLLDKALPHLHDVITSLHEILEGDTEASTKDSFATTAGIFSEDVE